MMTNPPQFSNRLPVGKAIIGAFLITWSSRKIFAQALAVPLFCLVAITVSWYYGEKFLPKEVEWALYFLYLVFWSIFAVICHRIVLLGSPPKTDWIPDCSWREVRFLGCLVSIWIIYVIAFVITVWIPTFIAANIFGYMKSDPAMFGWLSGLQIFAKFLAFYAVARLCLIFPAAALDKNTSLKLAWEQSRSNGWRLAIVIGGLPFVMSKLLGFFYRDAASAFEWIFLTFLGTAIVAVEVAALSISYRELTKNMPVE